jgi:hypothetical protein
MKRILLAAVVGLGVVQAAQAALITNPDDARSWQGATVGTFAQLYYGSNTLANRQQVVTKQLLDDGIFNSAGYLAATLLTPGGGGGCLGTSLDSTGTGSYDYFCGAGPIAPYANAIDNLWFQTSGTVGQTVFDLGFQATKAAVFNSIDHGPLPNEAIESTVYLSNDLINWTQAVVERVWLEGFHTNLGVLWDGFTYAVGTGTTNTFRYASVIHGGPGSLQFDGDNEINGIMGLQANFQGNPLPEPGTLALLAGGLLLISRVRRR